MAGQPADPFLAGDVRSNTDDSLENYKPPADPPAMAPAASTDYAALGGLETPTAQFFGGGWEDAPAPPQLSVEQYFSAQRSDTGGSQGLPPPTMQPGLSPNSLSPAMIAVRSGESASSVTDSDEFSDYSSGSSASHFIQDANGNLLQIPMRGVARRASEPDRAGFLAPSRSYENLSVRTSGGAQPDIHHAHAGVLSTTIPRAPSPQLVMMTSPMIRAIPSPGFSPSPSPSPAGSPSLGEQSVSPLAAQMSAFELNRRSRALTPEEVLDEFIKLERPYTPTAGLEGGLAAVQGRLSPGPAQQQKKRKESDRASQSGLSGDEGDKPARQTLYACPYPGCGKSFTRPYNLKSHYRSHTGERPYACSTCPLTFSRKHDLKRHEKLHTGAKPFTCIACGKSFARSDALARHLKSEPGKESPCAVRINLMNAREKFAEAAARRDEEAGAQAAALQGFSDESASEAAASPAYSAGYGAVGTPQVYALQPAGQPGTVLGLYQAMPGFQPAFVQGMPMQGMPVQGMPVQGYEGMYGPVTFVQGFQGMPQQRPPGT